VKKPKLIQNQIQELNEIIQKGKSSGPEVRRAQTILLVDREADSIAIKTVTGYSRRHAFTLRCRYFQIGISAVQDKRKGKPKELLNKTQRDELIDKVKTTSPTEHGYNNSYWTTGILGDFIEKEYEVKYKSKTSYYLIFKGARFTFHKPGKVYERRDEAEVKKWRKTAKIKIKKALADPKTVILAEDEMSLSMQTTFQKIWLPAGEYPKIEVSSQRTARSIYGFLNVRNGKEHAFKTEWQNMYITAEVLEKLRKVYPTEKILLIWDQAPSHKGSVAQKFIQDDKNIQTLHFPRAAPEENPQEHVWKDGRSKISHNRYIQNIDAVTDEFIEYLNKTEFHYSFLDWKIGAIS
jgi:transposase